MLYLFSKTLYKKRSLRIKCESIPNNIDFIMTLITFSFLFFLAFILVSFLFFYLFMADEQPVQSFIYQHSNENSAISLVSLVLDASNYHYRRTSVFFFFYQQLKNISDYHFKCKEQVAFVFGTVFFNEQKINLIKKSV